MNTVECKEESKFTIEDESSRDSGISITNPDEEEFKGTDVHTEKSAKSFGRVPLSDCANYQNSTERLSTPKSKSCTIGTPKCRRYNSSTSEYRPQSITSARSVDSQLSRKRLLSINQQDEKRRRRSAVFCDETLDDNVFEPEQSSEQQSKSSIALNISHRSCNLSQRRASDESLQGTHTIKQSLTHQQRAQSTSYLHDVNSGKSPSLPRHLEVEYTLECVVLPQKESQAFRSISRRTLAENIRQHGDKFNEKFVLVDCRYPYEYKGGHVVGAINIHKIEDMKTFFFPPDLNATIYKKIPIFYCEYSQKRGPSMAQALRTFDRVKNEARYPAVTYAEMYLLDYGYKNLWNDVDCRDVCEPRSYLPMDAPTHSHELRNFRGARLRSAAAKPTETSRLCKNKGIRRITSLFDVTRKHSNDSDDSLKVKVSGAQKAGTGCTAEVAEGRKMRAQSEFELSNISQKNLFQSEEVDVDKMLEMQYLARPPAPPPTPVEATLETLQGDEKEALNMESILVKSICRDGFAKSKSTSKRSVAIHLSENDGE